MQAHAPFKTWKAGPVSIAVNQGPPIYTFKVRDKTIASIPVSRIVGTATVVSIIALLLFNEYCTGYSGQEEMKKEACGKEYLARLFMEYGENCHLFSNFLSPSELINDYMRSIDLSDESCKIMKQMVVNIKAYSEECKINSDLLESSLNMSKWALSTVFMSLGTLTFSAGSWLYKKIKWPLEIKIGKQA